MSDSNEEMFFVDYIFTGVKNTAYVLSNIVIWFAGAFIDIMNSKRMQDLGLNMIIIYGQLMTEFENFGKYIYDNNDFAKDIVNTYNWMYDAFSSLISKKNREPENVNWIHTCCLNKDNANKYHYFETYKILNDEVNEEEINIAYKNAWCKNDEMSDFNVIMKYKDNYSVNWKKTENIEQRNRSRFSCLAISYKHKDDRAIPLEIPDSMWSVGNELFSPVFVRRCLEYQSDCYDFSYDYIVEIIDLNADVITLNSNQYLLVGQDSVSVKNIDANESDDENDAKHVEDDDDDEDEQPEDDDNESDSDYVPSEDE